MKDVTAKHFGLIIAFLIPGFLCLWGLSFSYPTIKPFLGKLDESESASFGKFLYATLMSLSLGLLLSAIRWAIVDRWLHRTVKEPRLNFCEAAKPDKYEVFQGIVDNHYRYYQYYSNSLVAVVISSAAYMRLYHHLIGFWLTVGVLALLWVLYVGSRDALEKYYLRAAQVLGEVPDDQVGVVK